MYSLDAIVEEIEKHGVSVEALSWLERRIISKAVEETLLTLPSLMKNITQQMLYSGKVVEDFFRENPDLVEHKELAAMVIEQVESQNPGKTQEELLRLALPEIRSRIKVKKGIPMKGLRRARELSLSEADRAIGEL